MRVLRHHPRAPLDTLIECFWWSERTDTMRAEHMLPTGAASLVFWLGDGVLSYRPANGHDAVTWSGALVHGPQTAYYTAGPKQPGISVGVAFRPGAAAALLGLPAGELCDRHVALDSIWGNRAHALHERISAARGPHEAFALLETELTARLRRPLLMHPAVADTLVKVRQPRMRVSAIRHDYSERHFIALFRNAVGLTPGQFFRVRRFSSVLRALASGQPQTLAGLATAAGYADQSHLNREFRQFSGTTPTCYRPRNADSPHHHVSGEGAATG